MRVIEVESCGSREKSQHTSQVRPKWASVEAYITKRLKPCGRGRSVEIAAGYWTPRLVLLLFTYLESPSLSLTRGMLQAKRPVYPNV